MIPECPLMLVAPVAILVAFSPTVSAVELPPDARPMTAEEVAAIYSGNSAVWESRKVYFSPEKKVRGIYGTGSAKLIPYAGVWSVAGNEACMRYNFMDDPWIYTDCWKWWHAGAKTLALWSVRYDGSKPNSGSGYYDQSKNIVPGDTVSKEYEKLEGN